MEQKEEKQGSQTLREETETQQSQQTLQKSYADAFVKMERYIELSALPEGAKKRCLKKISMKLLAAQTQGEPYRTVTGGNLQTFCDRMVLHYYRNTSLIQKGMLLAQVQLLAVITAVFVALIQSFAAPEIGLFGQGISIFLVYGMAVLEQGVQIVLHRILKRQVIYGNDKWYRHLDLAEWGIRLVCYGIYGGILYLTPLYRQVTTLPYMLESLAGAFCIWGACVAMQQYEEKWNPIVGRVLSKLPMPEQGKKWIGLVLGLLLAAGTVWLQIFYLKHQGGWGIWLCLVCAAFLTVWIAEWYERSRK